MRIYSSRRRFRKTRTVAWIKTVSAKMEAFRKIKRIFLTRSTQPKQRLSITR